MSNTSSTHTLKVEDGGSLKSLNKDAKDLKGNLDGAAQSASKLGRTPKATVAAKAAMARDSGQEISDYGKSRATAGTGAGARDFAKQAEGLGGLVRLYATFAANIFAATAAFGALSRAMDTTNMVKGLDQLGAASGRNLGTLAKRVSDITDNAVSLREAMESVAKASSAGMSSEQILRMGEAAKKASQALGVNMQDALSRLSRGISKVEPELLDELGIFVRVDDAQRKYALSIGKTVSNLTDFEKRQAFANAVLTQSEEKFKNIKIDANPYTKLAASLQNVAQSGLEVVNKVLTPIVELLAKSPTGLATVLAGIGITLLKQSIPAVGQWRAGLRAAAEDAANASKAFTSSMGDKFQDKLEKMFNIPMLTKQLDAAKVKLNDLGKNIAPVDFSKIKKFSSITKDGLSEEERLVQTNRLIKEKEDKIKSLATATEKKDIAAANKAVAELDNLRAVGAQLKNNIDYSKQQLTVKQLEAKQAEAWQKAINATDAGGPRKGVFGWFAKKFDPDTIETQKAVDLRKKSISMNATATAAETARIGGVRIAWQELNKTVEDEGLKGISKYTTLAKGGMAAVASRVMGVVGALGNVGMAIGILYGVYEALDAVFSKNKKQAEEASKAMQMLTESVENAKRTIENINTKDGLGFLSTESMIARSNALNDLTDNFVSSVKKMRAEVESREWWEKLTEGFASFFGGGKDKAYAKALADAISEGITLAGSGRSAKALKELSNLGLNGTNAKSMEIELKADPSKAAAAQKIFKELNREVGNVTSSAKSLDDAFAQASKTMDTMLVSAIPTEPLAKLGGDMMNISAQMVKAFEDPATAFNQLASIVGDTSKLRHFGDFGVSMVKQADAVKKNVAEIGELSKAINILEAAQAESNAKREEFIQSYTKNRSGEDKLAGYIQGNKVADREGLTLNKNAGDISLYKKQLAEAEKNAEKFVTQFRAEGAKMFSEGASRVFAAIGTGFAKAAITVSNAFASLMGDSIAGTNLRAENQKRLIDLDIRKLASNAEIIRTQERLRVAMEENTDQVREAYLNSEAGQKDPNTTKESRDRELTQIAVRRKNRFIVSNSMTGEAGDLKYAAEQTRQIDKLVRGSEEYNKQVDLANQANNKLSSSMSLQANKAEIAAKNAEKIAAEIARAAEVTAKEIRTRGEGLDVFIDTYNTQLDILNTTTSTSEYLSKNTLQAKQQYEYAILMVAQYKELQQIEAKRAAQKYIVDNSKNPEDIRQANNYLAEINAEEVRIREKQANARSAQTNKHGNEEITNIEKRAAVEFATQEKLRGYINTLLGQYNAIKDVVLDISDIQLSSAERSGAYTATTIANERMLLAIRKQQQQASSGMFDLKNQQESDRSALQEKIDSSKRKVEVYNPVSGTQPNQLAFNEAQDTLARDSEAMKALVQFQQSQITNQENINNLKLQALKITEQQNIEQAKFNDLTNKATSFAEALTSAFGKVGTAIGDMVTQSIVYNDANTKFLKERATAEANYNKIQNDSNFSPEEQAAARDKVAEIDDRIAQNNLANQAKLAANAKKMFGEKTVAYKALDAIEKASHIASMARMAKELGQSLINMTADVAGGSAKLVQQGGWAGFAGIAAFLAIMASLGFGGKGSAKMPSRENIQATQGTGQGYNSEGKLVDTGGGVLGDSSAKNEAIAKGIEMMSKNSFEGLGYSNRMLEVLTEIRDINKQASKGIIQAGLASSDTNTESSSILWGILGSDKKEITNKGIEFLGTLGELANNKGIIQAFTTTTTTSKGIFGLSSDSSSSDSIMDLKGTGLGNIFVDYFRKQLDLADVASASMGKTGESNARKILEAIPIQDIMKKISTMGLKGQELIDTLMSETGIAMDKAWLKAFPEMERFQTTGESFSETVMRIIHTTTQMTQGFKLAGLSLGDVNKYLQNITTITNPGTIVTKDELTGKYIDPHTNYLETQGGTFVEEVAGMWETTGRQITETVGRETKTISETVSEATDRIFNDYVKQLGGSLEKASEKLNTYITNFKTKQSQLDVYQATMQTDLGNIAGEVLKRYVDTALPTKDNETKRNNLADAIKNIDTREEFNALMSSLNLANKDDRELSAALINYVMPNLIKLTDDIRSLSDKDLTKAKRDQEIEKLKLMGQTSAAKELERKKTLEGLADPRLEAGQKEIWNLEKIKNLRNQETDILKLQGKVTEALVRSRQDEIDAVEDYLQAGIKLKHYYEDLNSVLDQYVTILQTEGKVTQSIALSREQQLKKLPDLLKIGQEYLWQLEDQKKIRVQEIALLGAQGYAYAATLASREDELAGMSDAEQAIRRKIHAQEDANKTDALNVELMQLNGDATQALHRTRQNELKGLSDTDQALKIRIWHLQDEAKITSLTTQYLEAMGYSYQASQMAREAERLTMTESERTLKDLIWAQEDKNKTEAIEMEILDASGKSAESLHIARQKELRGLSQTDQALKIRAWRLQDEKKLLDARNNQMIRMHQLLGNDAAANAISRKMALDEMDAQLRPMEEYLYALEDQMAIKEKLKEAYDRETEAAKNTISALRDSSKALKDYKTSLLIGDKSPLLPGEKYGVAKQKVLDLIKVASGPTSTDAERERVAQAKSDLTGAMDSFLEMSRTLFASSSTYTNDFNWVTNVLDQLTADTDNQLSTAEKQLNALEKNTTILDIIKDKNQTTNELLGQYLAAQTKAQGLSGAALGVITVKPETPVPPMKDPLNVKIVDETKVAQPTLPAGIVERKLATIDNGMVKGTNGYSATVGQAKSDIQALIDTNQIPRLFVTAVLNGISSSMIDQIMGWAPETANKFATSNGLLNFSNPTSLSIQDVTGVANVAAQTNPASKTTDPYYAAIKSTLDSTQTAQNATANNTAATTTNTSTVAANTTSTNTEIIALNQTINKLLNEVWLVKQELQALRQDQERHTGAVILAEGTAAQTVVSGVKEAVGTASSNSEWKERSSFKLA